METATETDRLKPEPTDTDSTARGDRRPATDLGRHHRVLRLELQDIGRSLEFTCKYCLKPVQLIKVREHQLLEHRKELGLEDEATNLRSDSPPITPPTATATSSKGSPAEESRTCKTCQKVLPADLLLAHIYTHCTPGADPDKGRPFACSLCKFSTCSCSHLKDHMAVMHYRIKRHKCLNCKTAWFGWHSALIAHSRRCTGQPELPMQVEKRSPQSQDQYQSAGSVANAEEHHACKSCRTQIPASLFVDHLVTHCAYNLGEFKCNLCEYTAKKKTRLLKDHLTSAHYGMKRHVCPNCNSRFTWYRTLINHSSLCGQLIHGCDKCSKRFRTSKQLATHSHFHSITEGDGRVIKCKICRKRFKTPAFLQHLITHVKDKGVITLGPTSCLYTCPMLSCQHQEKRIDLMRGHLAYDHHGIKPYECKACGTALKSVDNLREHTKFNCRGTREPGT